MTGRERAALIKQTSEGLADLDSESLAHLLLVEFDRRRLDDAGNQMEPPGLYRAAQTSMRALLVEPLDEEDTKLAQRLAA